MAETCPRGHLLDPDGSCPTCAAGRGGTAPDRRAPQPGDVTGRPERARDLTNLPERPPTGSTHGSTHGSSPAGPGRSGDATQLPGFPGRSSGPAAAGAAHAAGRPGRPGGPPVERAPRVPTGHPRATPAGRPGPSLPPPPGSGASPTDASRRTAGPASRPIDGATGPEQSPHRPPDQQPPTEPATPAAGDHAAGKPGGGLRDKLAKAGAGAAGAGGGTPGGMPGKGAASRDGANRPGRFGRQGAGGDDPSQPPQSKARAAASSGWKAAKESAAVALTSTTGIPLTITRFVTNHGLKIIGVSLVMVTFLFAAGTNLGDGDATQPQGSLDAADPGELPTEQAVIYRRAGDDHQVPWTILAAIGRVTTEHGRYGPDDVMDYEIRVDRAPDRASAQTAAADPQSGEPVPTTVAAGPGVSAEPYSGPVEDCEGDDCRVVPAIGVSAGAQGYGPLLLRKDLVEDAGIDPQNLTEAADALAEHLAELRDDTIDANDDWTDWTTNVDHADALWATVLSEAKVAFPPGSLGSAAGANAGLCASPNAQMRGNLVYPTTVPMGNRRFGMRLHPISGTMKMHNGVDMPGPEGTPIFAAASGTVQRAEFKGANGNHIVLDHGGGFTTWYLHLSAMHVAAGQQVTAGQVIGLMGTTGRKANGQPSSTGSHLHFETRQGGVPQDPELYFTAQLGDGLLDGAQAGTPVADTSGTTEGLFADVAPNPQDGTAIDPCSGVEFVGDGVHDDDPNPTAPDGGAQSGTPTAGGGGLTIPVAGMTPQMIIDCCSGQWGLPRSGGRTHQGIDLFTPANSEVVAAVDGTVSCSTAGPGGLGCWNGTGGLSVTIEGTDGNRYYATHLNEATVADGDAVRAGQRIGLSGSCTPPSGREHQGIDVNGNCVGTPSHVHFSINEGRDGVMDPFPLLTGSSASTAAGSGAHATSGGNRVLAYAVLYGGVTTTDPRAGTFPEDLATASNGSGYGGNFANLPQNEVTAMIRAEFARWGPQVQDEAVAVAQCESGLKPDANNAGTNTNGTTDHGLFQFNDGGTAQGILRQLGEDPNNIELFYDPSFASRGAELLFQQRGWQPWVCAKKLGLNLGKPGARGLTASA